MRRIIKRLSLVLLTLTLSSTAIWAQGTAQISGTVKDQTGAVLPGVEVTATQTETGVARSTVSNETGSFVDKYYLDAQSDMCNSIPNY